VQLADFALELVDVLHLRIGQLAVEHDQVIEMADIRRAEYEKDMLGVPAELEIPVLDGALEFAVQVQPADGPLRLVIEILEPEDDMRPRLARKWRAIQIHRWALFGSHLRTVEVVGIPDLNQQSDREAELTRRRVLGPFEQDEAFLGVFADDLHGIAIAGHQVLVGIELQSDRHGRDPVLVVVVEYAVALELRESAGSCRANGVER
jgi:hypothetical protein